MAETVNSKSYHIHYIRVIVLRIRYVRLGLLFPCIVVNLYIYLLDRGKTV